MAWPFLHRSPHCQTGPAPSARIFDKTVAFPGFGLTGTPKPATDGWVGIFTTRRPASGLAPVTGATFRPSSIIGPRVCA